MKAVLLGSAPILVQEGLTESLAGRFELHLPHCRSTYLTAVLKGSPIIYPLSFLRIFVFGVPPFSEQLSIVQTARSETRFLQRAIREAEGQIGLLQECRTRLLADVVTGKLDVQEAAARLPEEPKDTVPEDLPDEEAGASEDELDAVLDEAGA